MTRVKKKIRTIYVVYRGVVPGIYFNAKACMKQVDDYPDAHYVEYKSLRAAEDAFREYCMNSPFYKKPPVNTQSDFILTFGSCSIRRITKMRYYARFSTDSRPFFKSSCFHAGDDMIADFLALMYAIRCVREHNLGYVIYTKNETAYEWVRDRKTNSHFNFKHHIKLRIAFEKAEDYLDSISPNEFLDIRIWKKNAFGDIKTKIYGNQKFL